MTVRLYPSRTWDLVDQWLEYSEHEQIEAFHVAGSTAFGNLYVCGERTGDMTHRLCDWLDLPLTQRSTAQKQRRSRLVCAIVLGPEPHQWLKNARPLGEHHLGGEQSIRLMYFRLNAHMNPGLADPTMASSGYYMGLRHAQEGRPAVISARQRAAIAKK